MQSVNEELQSTNEELETSKEELQSVNEELATVNVELQTKVIDLSRVNNDMNNLLAGTGIGTIFVDHHLRILRYTPAVSAIINLIVSDVGRPVAHIVSNMVGYNGLITDVQGVLDTLVPKEQDVVLNDGKIFSMRIKPYRTLGNVIEGAVISFVDISHIRQMQMSLNRSSELLEHMGEMAQIGGWQLDLLTKKLHWSKQTYAIHELSPTLTQTMEQAISYYTPDDRPRIQSAIDQAIKDGISWDLELSLISSSRRLKWVRVQGFPVKVEGKVVTLFGAIQDITVRKETSEALRKANDLMRLAVVVRDAYDAITVHDLEGRIIAWNPGAERMYGWSEAEALTMNVRDRIPADQREQALARFVQLSHAEVLQPYVTQRLTKSGKIVTVSLISTALMDSSGKIYAIAKTERAIVQNDL